MLSMKLGVITQIPLEVNLLFFLSTFGSSISSVAMTQLFYTALNLQPASVTSLYASYFIPYQIRAVFSLFSDLLPVRGCRRKPYIQLGLIGSAVSGVLLGLMSTSFNSALLYGLLFYFFQAITTIMFETYLVEWSQGSQGPKNTSESLVPSSRTGSKDLAILVQTASYTFQTLGDLLGSAAAIPLNGTNYSPRIVFASTSLVWLLAFLISFRMHEIPIQRTARFREPCKVSLAFLKLLIRRNLPELIFLFVVFGLPSVTDTWDGYVYSRFSQSPAVLNVFSAVGSLGSLIGIAIVALLSRRFNLRIIFSFGIFISCAATVLSRFSFAKHFQFGLSDQVYLGLVTFIESICTELKFMPAVLLATFGATRSLEGFMFSIYFTVIDGADQVAARLSAVMTDRFNVRSPEYDNAPTLFLVCGLIGIVPLLLVMLVPATPAFAKLEVPEPAISECLLEPNDSREM